MFSEFTSTASSSASVLAGVLNTSRDILVLAGIFAGIFFYCLWAGKKATLASLFALIFAGLLFVMFPYWNLITTPPAGVEDATDGLWMKGGVFLALFLAVRFAVHGSVRGIFAEEKAKKWLEAFLLTTVFFGLGMVYAYQLIALSAFYPLPAPIAFLIIAPPALFWWPIAAFVVAYLFSE